MNIDQLKTSKFLKRSDVGAGVLVTISSVKMEDVSLESSPDEKLMPCIYFKELEKPLTANWTNINLISNICGSKETDEWTGKMIVLYDDPTVSYQGKVTGGIRCRAPKNRTAAAPAAKPAPASPIDDNDVPY